MATPNKAGEVICSCAVCGKDLIQGDHLADGKVYKMGELSYISLAHVACVKGLPNTDGWEWDEEPQQGPWDPDPDHNDQHANYEIHSGLGEYNPMYGNCDVLGQTEW